MWDLGFFPFCLFAFSNIFWHVCFCFHLWLNLIHSGLNRLALSFGQARCTSTALRWWVGLWWALWRTAHAPAEALRRRVTCKTSGSFEGSEPPRPGHSRLDCWQPFWVQRVCHVFLQRGEHLGSTRSKYFLINIETAPPILFFFYFDSFYVLVFQRILWRRQCENPGRETAENGFPV